MVRCKCGRYSNFGLTCSSCRGVFLAKNSEEVEPNFEMIEKPKEEENDISFEEVEDFFKRDDDYDD